MYLQVTACNCNQDYQPPDFVSFDLVKLRSCLLLGFRV